ncbi:hypothetical protein LTR62_004483 [Meristemomyces frigidus]|uniref:Required for respiratory growth protein 9, mitochondrial n=1 Tax=Meristemomyces frigidus TaxID=1508187 RepID=A0AAN7TQS7_9PEZI|nr:hypothetical protein LTR62_004483 [Meristemomyces frigidus]
MQEGKWKHGQIDVKRLDEVGQQQEVSTVLDLQAQAVSAELGDAGQHRKALAVSDPQAQAVLAQLDEVAQYQETSTVLDPQAQAVLAKLDAIEQQGPNALSELMGSVPLRTPQPQVLASRTKPGPAPRAEEPTSNRILPKIKREPWQLQKNASERKFGEAGWQPRKRLSPDTLDGIRALHASDPSTYSTAMLSSHFKITDEAIRRILKSKWQPDDDEAEDRRVRWERRGAKKWQAMAELGVRAPAKWRSLGVGSEEGVREERLPRRRRRGGEEGGLSWDEVIGGVGGVEEGVGRGNLAERLL